MTMMAGTYYVGDLCYVMHEEWNECCGLFFEGRDDHGCNQGEFNLKSGVRFACFNTMHGDGSYLDQYLNDYCVDSGSIGCIRIGDINPDENPEKYRTLGKVHTFDKPFEVYSHNGVIHIGHIKINTDY